MWNEEELLLEIDAYFDQVSEKEFMKDLFASGSIDMVEDIMLPKFEHTYSMDSKSSIITFTTTEEVKIKNQQFKKIASTFKTSKNIISNEIHMDNLYSGSKDEYAIGA